MNLLKRFYDSASILDNQQKKFIHYRSAENFLKHLEEIKPIEEYEKCRTFLEQYISMIETEGKNINKDHSSFLFYDYIYPLGFIYEMLNFKYISPLKTQLITSVICDLLIWILFLKFPIPIISFLIIINYNLRLIKYLKTTKVFGIFY